MLLLLLLLEPRWCGAVVNGAWPSCCGQTTRVSNAGNPRYLRTKAASGVPAHRNLGVGVGGNDVVSSPPCT